jgi:hypothetical protein
MDQFNLSNFLKNNPLLKEGDFPSVGETIDVTDIDYDMMSYLSRTNKELIVTLKNGEKVESTVGPFHNDLIFHGEFPENIKDRDYKLQKKAFDNIQIVG